MSREPAAAAVPKHLGTPQRLPSAGAPQSPMRVATPHRLADDSLWCTIVLIGTALGSLLLPSSKLHCTAHALSAHSR